MLIVEDDEDIRESIAELLRDDGYQVVGARNGADAMDLLKRGMKPSVLLTDLMMPVMTGWELVAKVRADATLAALPVIVTSAAADRAPPESDRVLGKPLRLDVLVDSVAELCRRGAPRSGPRTSPLQELAQRNVNLVELQQFRDEMSSLIVHDMKNPLTAIVSNLHFALGEMPESEAREAVLDACEATERLNRLVQNLLHVVKLESGRFLPQREEVSVRELVASIVDRLETHTKGSDVRVTSADVPDAVASLDRELVSRCLDNIIDNAVRYTPAGGRIHVEATVGAEALQLEIGNSGAPIPREARQAIFDKYGQAGTAGGRVNLGLGLYFCRLVAEAHGGSISVRETDALPTVFVLRLPRSAPLA